MKTKSLKKNKVNVVTLGCSKNLVDSEVLMGQLRANAFQVTHESGEDDAQIIIINTCGFIDNAKQESIDTIVRYAKAKQEGMVDKVYVTGCLSERYKPELEKEIPEVDGYFGTRDLPRLLKTLKADYKKELVGERLLTTPRHFAYLKIAEGCDRPCAFCAIPLMRGAHVSRPIEELVAEAESLVAGGTKEIILIAQDLTYYGLDIYKKRRLSALLEALVKVDGLEWIRLHYAFPGGFPLDVLDVMQKEEKICKYLDMPLQHISDKMLASMRRGTTREKTNALIKTIREKVPGIAIRTTLIAGFPGETQADFEELKNWVIETRFDRLGIFTYSHEEQTHAYKLNDDVPAATKRRRADKIMEVQQEISRQINTQKIGKTFRVMVDRQEGDFLICRTEHDSPEVDNEVLVASEFGLIPGSFANIKITSADDYDLHGIPC